MKVKQVVDRLSAEKPNTDYAAGVLAYADAMLRNLTGYGMESDLPTSFSGLEGVLLGDFDDWESKGRATKLMGDGKTIARKLGLDKVLDVEKSDMGKVQGQAMKSAFMLIWAEVECLNRMNETFLIRRTGR